MSEPSQNNSNDDPQQVPPINDMPEGGPIDMANVDFILKQKIKQASKQIFPDGAMMGPDPVILKTSYERRSDNYPTVTTVGSLNESPKWTSLERYRNIKQKSPIIINKSIW